MKIIKKCEKKCGGIKRTWGEKLAKLRKCQTGRKSYSIIFLMQNVIS